MRTNRNVSQYPPRRAFSLVELVIVIVIIGIVAAIAVPRISRSATGANEAALQADLNVLRHAIDKYAAEHTGVFPGANEDGDGNSANSAGAFVNQLTKYSDVNGKIGASRTKEFQFGPYVHKIPALPVGGNLGESGVEIDASNSPPLVKAKAAGWVYNPTTGEIIANSDDAANDSKRTYDQF
ncbi:MAG: prepilin-type N-terminal cleavage/methylation domain-containing protein [Phycisphaerales bacterium]|nr:prepilin-type N-terminal cleavage/methylation domain-containing protein [Phycisphaerales bacterium]